MPDTPPAVPAGIPADALAAITRAVLDKAGRELAPYRWMTGTVALSEGATTSPFPKVTVNVDGDPQDQLSEMHLVGGGSASVGDRVVIAAVPPEGAWAFPLSKAATACIVLTNECGSGPV